MTFLQYAMGIAKRAMKDEQAYANAVPAYETALALLDVFEGRTGNTISIENLLGKIKNNMYGREAIEALVKEAFSKKNSSILKEMEMSMTSVVLDSEDAYSSWKDENKKEVAKA